MDTDTADLYHLEAHELECPTCEAGPGENCTTLPCGNGYILTEYHPSRYETASYHLLDIYSQDGHVVAACGECDYEDVN